MAAGLAPVSERRKVLESDLRALCQSLRAGSKLPSGKALEARYNLSDKGIKPVIDALRADGLLCTIYGAGFFTGGPQHFRPFGSAQHSASQKRYYETNKKKCRDAVSAWKALHPDSTRRHSRAWRQANRYSRAKYNRAYRRRTYVPAVRAEREVRAWQPRDYIERDWRVAYSLDETTLSGHGTEIDRIQADASTQPEAVLLSHSPLVEWAENFLTPFQQRAAYLYAESLSYDVAADQIGVSAAEVEQAIAEIRQTARAAKLERQIPQP